MKTSANVAVILLVVAAILGLSVASAVREQHRLLEEFTVATQRQVHASVELLSARLDALDQDTRLLIDLVERSRRNREFDPATELRIWTTAFQALATVVPQYRVIYLYRGDGQLEVRAIDPTEGQSMVAALADPSRRLAAAVSASGAKALAKPATRHGERSFLLYGTPVGGGGAVVVASDVAIFLGGTTWTPLPVARLFVTDPAGVVWSGCETPHGCRSTHLPALQRVLSAPVSIVSTIEPPAAEELGLGRTRAVRISERIDRATGAWTVSWLASSKATVDRDRRLLFRLVATAMAAAIAVAGVGMVILRQQRKAVALQGQLRFTEALASARETSESIVENAPLGVLGVSQTGTVVLANRFLIDRLGPIRLGASLADAFSGEGVEWIGEVAPLLLMMASDGQQQMTDMTGMTPAMVPTVRTVATAAHEFHVRLVPVRNHQLGVRAFVLAEDQSELRKLESQLVRAEKLITVGVLSAGIAHEIGSPLAVIRGRAEQVLRLASEGRGAEDLRVIIKHIDHISSTIRQLLDFSRRQPIAVRRAVPLTSAVERARELLQWKLTGKALDLRVVIANNLPALAADPDQLQQVLVNLLLNACDASTSGAPVWVTAQSAPGGIVRLEIVDQGCGIAAEHMNAVFDPFFTTKKRGEGTGLGLPIVASIVRNHAGEINLASVPGKGTTVTVFWPYSAEQKAWDVHA